jgi:hypothetical protein
MTNLGPMRPDYTGAYFAAPDISSGGFVFVAGRRGGRGVGTVGCGTTACGIAVCVGRIGPELRVGRIGAAAFFDTSGSAVMMLTGGMESADVTIIGDGFFTAPPPTDCDRRRFRCKALARNGFQIMSQILSLKVLYSALPQVRFVFGVYCLQEGIEANDNRRSAKAIGLTREMGTLPSSSLAQRA